MMNLPQGLSIQEDDKAEVKREKYIVLLNHEALKELGLNPEKIVSLFMEITEARKESVRKAERTFIQHRKDALSEEKKALDLGKVEKNQKLKEIHGLEFHAYERDLLKSTDVYNSSMFEFKMSLPTICKDHQQLEVLKLKCSCLEIAHEGTVVIRILTGDCRFKLRCKVGGCEVYQHLGNGLDYVRDRCGAYTRRYLIRALDVGEHDGLFSIGLPCENLVRSRKAQAEIMKLGTKEIPGAFGEIIKDLSLETKRKFNPRDLQSFVASKINKWSGQSYEKKDWPTLFGDAEKDVKAVARLKLKGTVKGNSFDIGSRKGTILGLADNMFSEWENLSGGKKAKQIYSHVREGSTSGSYLISFSTTKHGIYGSTGLPFYRPEKGMVVVDAAKLTCPVIDVHAPTTIDAFRQLLQSIQGAKFVNLNSNDTWERTVRDFLRTREVLVIVNVPPEAVICRRTEGQPWEYNNAYRNDEEVEGFKGDKFLFTQALGKGEKILDLEISDDLEAEKIDLKGKGIPKIDSSSNTGRDVKDIMRRHFGDNFK